MNIVLSNHYAGSPAYGMEFRPYFLAKEWVSMGHHVTIFAASESHVRRKRPTMGRENIDGIEYRWISTPPYSGNGVSRAINMGVFVAGLYHHLRHYYRTRHPDVIIASSTYPSDIYPCMQLARSSNAKLIWEVHDLWPLSPIELGRMSAWHPFIMAMQHGEDFACRHADVVISMLPAADRHLVSRGLDISKYHHIPNGIDMGDWRSSTNPLPDEISKAFCRLRVNRRFIIGYAGAYGTANALTCLVSAIAALRHLPISCICVGQGPEQGHLTRLAQTLNADVQFFNSIPRNAVPAFLANCDALYIGLQRQPLFRYGISPNKLYDYAMAGKPIICAIDAPNQLVEDAHCGLVLPPENPSALANAISHLATISSSEREHMGMNGRKYVTAHFDYAELARRFASHFAP